MKIHRTVELFRTSEMPGDGWFQACLHCHQITAVLYYYKTTEEHKAIIEYVDDVSVQMHVLFPAAGLWSVSEHFKKLYGPPSEQPDIWTALIGQPKRPNRVLRWYSRNTRTGSESILEIREIDDLR